MTTITSTAPTTITEKTWPNIIDGREVGGGGERVAPRIGCDRGGEVAIQVDMDCARQMRKREVVCAGARIREVEPAVEQMQRGFAQFLGERFR